MERSVLLPEPLLPTIEMTSPSSSERSSPERISTRLPSGAGNDLDIPSRRNSSLIAKHLLYIHTPIPSPLRSHDDEGKEDQDKGKAEECRKRE